MLTVNFIAEISDWNISLGAVFNISVFRSFVFCLQISRSVSSDLFNISVFRSFFPQKKPSKLLTGNYKNLVVQVLNLPIANTEILNYFLCLSILFLLENKSPVFCYDKEEIVNLGFRSGKWPIELLLKNVFNKSSCF